MLLVINEYLPYLGVALCVIAWRFQHFNTKPFCINLIFILFMLFWLFLYLADANPEFNPTFGSIMGRIFALAINLLLIFYVRFVTIGYRAFKLENQKLEERIAKLETEKKEYTHE